MLNELIPHGSSQGPYYAGLISAWAWSNGEDPTRNLILAAIRCTNILQAQVLWTRYWHKRRAGLDPELAAQCTAEELWTRGTQ